MEWPTASKSLQNENSTSLLVFFFPLPLRNPYFYTNITQIDFGRSLKSQAGYPKEFAQSQGLSMLRADCVMAAGASGSQPGCGGVRAPFMLMNDWGW